MLMIRRGVEYYNITDGRRAVATSGDEREKGTTLTVALRSADNKIKKYVKHTRRRVLYILLNNILELFH